MDTDFVLKLVVAAGFVTVGTVIGMCCLVLAMGFVVERVANLVLLRAMELAVIPDPNAPHRVADSPVWGDPDPVDESVAEFRSYDPTDWSIPEEGRPQVVGVRPGESLVPR